MRAAIQGPVSGKSTKARNPVGNKNEEKVARRIHEHKRILSRYRLKEVAAEKGGKRKTREATAQRMQTDIADAQAERPRGQAMSQDAFKDMLRKAQEAGSRSS